MTRAALLALIPALLLASCGGGDDGGNQTAAEYRADLNKACRQLAEDTGKITQAVQDQGLDLSQAQALAQAAGERFQDSLGKLEPPASLKKAHQELIEVGEAQPQSASPAQVRALAERFLGLYTRLGARDCQQLQRQALATLPSG